MSMLDRILSCSLLSEKVTKSFKGRLIKDTKIQKLQNIVDNGQMELKIAIPNSEQVADSFSERIGIFVDKYNDAVAFTGTSRESFSTETRDSFLLCHKHSPCFNFFQFLKND